MSKGDNRNTLIELMPFHQRPMTFKFSSLFYRTKIETIPCEIRKGPMIPTNLTQHFHCLPDF